ncbi:DUF4429 domain-containing protein [Collimonas humicola]|uniref:DUF4429 domain-containing protein n=1 Tax=Collimonas humicola TaxID=2825886 RepID=UPI001B8AD0DA|nr:DUF4429 domain-containing protein [Collimonas humicola]
MQVRGVNGQVTLLSDRIQIKRAGAMARLTQARNSDKDILLTELSGVRIQLPNLLSNGYIRFFLVNGEAADASLIRAASDGNTVLFSGRQLSRFTLLKTAVEKKIAANQPAPMLLLPAPEITATEATAPEITASETTTPEMAAPAIIAPAIAAPIIPAERPPVDFDALDRVAEQYKQGLISRAEWVAAKRKLLGL